MLGAARRACGALLALALLPAAEVHARGPSDPTPRGAVPAARDDWRKEASWQRLRVGMSQLDVLRILGEPGRITRYYAFERWEYPDALGRRVNFDERGRLIAWGARAR